MSSVTPVFWLSGNYFDVSQKFSEILTKIPKAEIIPIDPDLISAQEFLLRLKQRDLFDTKPKIYRVLGVFEDYDVLTDQWQWTNLSKVVVFTCPVGRWSSRRFTPLKNTKFYKSIAALKNPPASVRLHHFPETFDEIPYAWVSKVLLSFEKTIDVTATDRLVERVGRHADTLYAHLSLLAHACPDKDVTADFVDQVCVSEFTRTVWDLVDALFLKNTEGGLEQLEQFFERSGPALVSEVQSLLGGLAYAVGFILFAKSSCSTRMEYTNVSASLATLKKLSVSDEGEKTLKPVYEDYVVRKNMARESYRSVLAWPKQKIYNLSDLVFRAREQCRMGISSSRIRMLLDGLVLFASDQISRKDWLDCLLVEE